MGYAPQSSPPGRAPGLLGRINRFLEAVLGRDEVSSPPDELASPPDAAEPDPFAPRTILLRVVTFIGASVTFATLVAVLGAGILYVRFFYADLPPAQAIRVIENAELVTFGASSLVLFVLVGLAAVAFVYLVDRYGRANTRTGIGLTTLVGLEMIYAVWVVPLEARTVDMPQWLPAVGLAVAVVAVIAAAVKVPSARRAWVAAVAVLVLAGLIALLVAEPSWVMSPKEIRWLLTAGLILAILLGSWLVTLRVRWESAVPLLVLLLALEVVAAALLLLLVDWVLGAVLLLTALLGGALLRVADVSGTRFLPYAFAVFLSLPIFGAAVLGLQVARDPKGQPVALLRKDDPRGTCGLFVTETDDRVYLGFSDGRREGNGRLFYVPRDQVTAMSVGPLQSVKKANARAAELRRELLELEAAADPPAPLQETVTETVTRRAGRPTRRVTVRKFTRPRASGQGAPRAAPGAPEPISVSPCPKPAPPR